MALNLLINGRVLVQQANQLGPFSTPDNVAAALGARSRAERDTARAGQPGRPARLLGRDVVLDLFEDGKLGAAQARAGLEARLVYEAVTSAVAARITRYGATGCDGLSNADWPPSLKAAAERYSAWADWAKTCAITPRFTLVELVQDVAIDGLGMSQVTARRGIHHVTALRWVQKGLYRYAVMAGWIEGLENVA
jgi:hypothetical protein